MYCSSSYTGKQQIASPVTVELLLQLLLSAASTASCCRPLAVTVAAVVGVSVPVLSMHTATLTTTGSRSSVASSDDRWRSISATSSC
jgi:hypothetical protein